MVLNLIKRDGSIKASVKRKLNKAAIDDNFKISIIKNAI